MKEEIVNSPYITIDGIFSKGDYSVIALFSKMTCSAHGPNWTVLFVYLFASLNVAHAQSGQGTHQKAALLTEAVDCNGLQKVVDDFPSPSNDGSLAAVQEYAASMGTATPGGPDVFTLFTGCQCQCSLLHVAARLPAM
ncbi:hypothetical protein ACOMHN_000278 [Nucella lapillus]